MNKEFNIKNTGFKVPKDYFEGIEDAVFSSLGEEHLKQVTNKVDLGIPEGYFDSFEDRVMAKINKPEPKVISLQTKRILYSVASIAAILVLYFTLYNNAQPATLESLDTELVENYILDQNIDSYELASLLTEEELASLDISIVEEDISDESLEEYILDNIELETILEQ